MEKSTQKAFGESYLFKNIFYNVHYCRHIGYSCDLLQPYSFVIKIDFENQIFVNINHKLNISQYNIVYHDMLMVKK